MTRHPRWILASRFLVALLLALGLAGVGVPAEAKKKPPPLPVHLAPSALLDLSLEELKTLKSEAEDRWEGEREELAEQPYEEHSEEELAGLSNEELAEHLEQTAERAEAETEEYGQRIDVQYLEWAISDREGIEASLQQLAGQLRKKLNLVDSREKAGLVVELMGRVKSSGHPNLFFRVTAPGLAPADAEKIVIPDVWGASITVLRETPGPPHVWEIRVQETAKWVAYWSEASRRTRDLLGKLIAENYSLLQ